MDQLRIDVEAVERAMRRAKDELNEARDRRSHISMELDECEDRIEAAGESKHRSREFETLRREYDASRARVYHALDAHTELSKRYLELLSRLTEAEDVREPASRRGQEEPRRQGWTRARQHASRRAYDYTSTSRRNPSDSFDNSPRYDYPYRFDGHTEKRYDRAPARGSRSHFDYEGYFTTDERMPRSEYDHRSARSEPASPYEDEGYYMSDADSEAIHRGRHERRHKRTERRHSRPDPNGLHDHFEHERNYTAEERTPRSEQHYHHGNRRACPRSISRDYYAQSEHSQYGRTESHTQHNTEEREPRRQSASNGPQPRTRRTTRDYESSYHYGGSTPRPQQQRSRGGPSGDRESSVPPRSQPQAEHPTRLPSQQTVSSWWKYANHCFEDYTNITQFPIPPTLCCGKPDCDATSSLRPFVACEHTVRASFGMAGITNLKRERLRWHPDKFSACQSNLQESFKKMASEVFTACG